MLSPSQRAHLEEIVQQVSAELQIETVLQRLRLFSPPAHYCTDSRYPCRSSGTARGPAGAAGVAASSPPGLALSTGSFPEWHTMPSAHASQRLWAVAAP